MHDCTCYTCARVKSAKGGPDFLGFLSPTEFAKYEKLMENWITGLVQDVALRAVAGQVGSLTQLIATVEREILRSFKDPPPEILNLLESQASAGLQVGAGKLPVALAQDQILDSIPKLVNRHVLAIRNLGSNAAKNSFAQIMEDSVREGDGIDTTVGKIQEWAESTNQVGNMTK